MISIARIRSTVLNKLGSNLKHIKWGDTELEQTKIVFFIAKIIVNQFPAGLNTLGEMRRNWLLKNPFSCKTLENHVRFQLDLNRSTKSFQEAILYRLLYIFNLLFMFTKQNKQKNACLGKKIKYMVNLQKKNLYIIIMVNKPRFIVNINEKFSFHTLSNYLFKK